ncbi:hypothetical protein B296_00035127 [Ensete ventricosum]|uniref:Uncharacterized protein n=1 Tax=Ensete ventricosum TaxID=4639 RepID=A0A426X1M3_ENSVE|nr:hypothetical protein B296_00035127 [Ensete ventricosum]
MVLKDNLCVDLILQSLPNSFSQFIIDLNMNKFEVTQPELLNMLTEAESTIKKEKSVLYIGETNRKRNASKTLKKGKGKERPGKTKVAKKDRVRQRLPRNTRQRIKDSASTTAKMVNGRGIIRTTLQIRRNRSLEKLKFQARPKRLAQGKIDLKMRNGARVVIVTVGEVTLHLPGGVSLH